MIFVVGPSRGGKTTLLRLVLPEFPTLTLLDLDAEERPLLPGVGGWPRRWRRDFARIQAAAAAQPGGEVIVDVGAGSRQTAEGQQFFTENGERSIAVVAPFEVVLARHPRRDPEDFRSNEYSDEHQRVYRAARFQVDTGGALEQSIAQCRAAVRALVDARAL